MCVLIAVRAKSWRSRFRRGHPRRPHLPVIGCDCNSGCCGFWSNRPLRTIHGRLPPSDHNTCSVREPNRKTFSLCIVSPSLHKRPVWWRTQAIVDLRIAWQKTLPQAKGSTTKTNRTMLMPPQCYNEVKVSQTYLASLLLDFDGEFQEIYQECSKKKMSGGLGPELECGTQLR